MGVGVAGRPLAQLKVFPERSDSSSYATDPQANPQQGFGYLAQCLQHLERTLRGSERRHHILGVLGQGINLGFDSYQAVVDFSMGDVSGHGCPLVRGIFAGLRRTVSRFGCVALCQPLQIFSVVGIGWVKGDECVVRQAFGALCCACEGGG